MASEMPEGSTRGVAPGGRLTFLSMRGLRQMIRVQQRAHATLISRAKRRPNPNIETERAIQGCGVGGAPRARAARSRSIASRLTE